MHSMDNMSSKLFIKTLLLYRGIRARDLARQLKISDSMLSMLIAGKRRSPKIEARIAGRLGVPRKTLWKA